MKRERKRLILYCFVSLMVVALLAPAILTGGCGEAEPTLTEWDIPVISVLTGAIAFVGVPAVWGAEFAADEINEAGGIRGVPIKITSYDTAFDNAKAVSAMARAIEGTLVVVGPMDGPGAEAAGTTAAEAGVPFIAALAAPDTRARFEPWGASYMQDDAAGDGPAATEWINQNPDIESVVVLYDPGMPVMVDQFNAVKGALEALGVEVLGPIEVQTGQVDMGPAAVNAINLNPDGYYCILAGEYATLVTELCNRGVTEGRRICSSFSGMNPMMFEIAGDNLENTYIYDKMYIGYEGAEWQKVVEAYQADHDGQLPTLNTVPTFYDAIYAIKAAFEAQEITGDPDKLVEEREKISEFLYNSPEMDGVQGAFQFVDGKKVAPVFFYQIINGQLVLISIIET